MLRGDTSNYTCKHKGRVGCSRNKCLLEVEPKCGYFGNASLPNAITHIENPKNKTTHMGGECMALY